MKILIDGTEKEAGSTETVKLVGCSQTMQTVHRLIERIAPTNCAVVILGETGTGKELVARSIHLHSKRNDKPYVAVNCGALPENLIESELFGHRKGSFTGADGNRTGLLEVADGGTLFLDEIGELPKGVQSKLLRFLESGEVRKIGENAAANCDVRVVCATLRNLEEMVQSGDFRQDLWFRINTFEIHIPPLRDRQGDLPELIEHFINKSISPGAGVESCFTSEAYKALLNYDYPGNVRQLANIIEHALVLTDKLPIPLESLPIQIQNFHNDFHNGTGAFNLGTSIAVPGRPQERPVLTGVEEHLPAGKVPVLPETSDSSSSILFNTQSIPTLRDLESKAIEKSLKKHGGNKVRAAEELGISLKTLYNKINQTERKSA
ncbi:hypothetical protein FACS189419_01620 [Planctomycetales bacterium]|nr:hypothetical protein FACS189419_01620 [Planctomycetales bacterium]